MAVNIHAQIGLTDMRLSIITINRNNAEGLRKTMESVCSQTCKDFEYIVIDGASSDGSVDVIKEYALRMPINWVSERDTGIFNAMNKGIGRATGQYLHFLNSGDALFDSGVVGNMLKKADENNDPNILVGQLYALGRDGSARKTETNDDFSLLRFYVNFIPHPSTYIKRSLFAEYGLYDEKYRIVSDWKWFLQVVVMNGVKPVLTDADVTLFDTSGVSETNPELDARERRMVLEEVIPPAILENYDSYSNVIFMMQHIRSRKWAYKMVKYLDKFLYLIEGRK